MATKKCKYCQTEIDKKAKVCPNCKRSLKSHTGLYALLILVLFFCIAVGSSINTTDISTTSNSNSVTDNNTTNSTSISLSEFNQIQNGMTYEEVVEIIGSNGTLTAESGTEGYVITMYTWYGSNYAFTGANANVTFTNNQVTAKAQVGLN